MKRFNERNFEHPNKRRPPNNYNNQQRGGYRNNNNNYNYNNNSPFYNENWLKDPWIHLEKKLEAHISANNSTLEQEPKADHN